MSIEQQKCEEKVFQSMLNVTRYTRILDLKTLSNSYLGPWTRQYGHWFCSQSLQWFSGIAFDSDCQMTCRASALPSNLDSANWPTNCKGLFDVLWNPWINCVEFEFFLGLLNFQNWGKQWVVSNPHPRTSGAASWVGLRAELGGWLGWPVEVTLGQSGGKCGRVRAGRVGRNMCWYGPGDRFVYTAQKCVYEQSKEYATNSVKQ